MKHKLQLIEADLRHLHKRARDERQDHLASCLLDAVCAVSDAIVSVSVRESTKRHNGAHRIGR